MTTSDTAKASPASRSTLMAMRLMGGALLSKLFGFVREILMARTFGASVTADGFRTSMAGILIPLGPLQDESVPGILVPLHREWREQGVAPQMFAALAVMLVLVTVAIMAALMGAGQYYIDLIVHGFSPQAKRQAFDFFWIMALSMPGSVLLNCLAAVEIAIGRSRISATRATVLNLSVIGGIVLYMVTGHLSYLPWAVVLAFDGYGLYGLYTLDREGVLDLRGVTPVRILKAGREFFIRLRPFLKLPLAEQVQILIERRVASGFGTGTVASLSYARTLTDSASLLVSQPLGLAVLYKGARSTPGQVEGIVRPLLALALPVSVFIAAFAPDIISIIFERGAFDEHAVQLTSNVMRGISLGLWATVIGQVLLRMIYNEKRNHLAVRILMSAYIANAFCNVLAMGLSPATNSGAFVLGMGESVRGLVLLAGTVWVLGGGRMLVRLLARSLLFLVPMILAVTLAATLADSPVQRLSLGLPVLAVAGLAALYLIAPDHLRNWLARLNRT